MCGDDLSMQEKSLDRASTRCRCRYAGLACCGCSLVCPCMSTRPGADSPRQRRRAHPHHCIRESGQCRDHGERVPPGGHGVLAGGRASPDPRFFGKGARFTRGGDHATRSRDRVDGGSQERWPATWPDGSFRRRAYFNDQCASRPCGPRQPVGEERPSLGQRCGHQLGVAERIAERNPLDLGG